MTDVYIDCPQYEDERYLLRPVKIEDKSDLLKVYSDKKAVPFLTVIIAVAMIFIIQLKAGWSRLLNIGFGNTAERALSVGPFCQRRLMK